MKNQEIEINAIISKCCMAPLDSIGCCMKCGEEAEYKELKIRGIEVVQKPFYKAVKQSFVGIFDTYFYYIAALLLGMVIGKIIILISQ